VAQEQQLAVVAELELEAVLITQRLVMPYTTDVVVVDHVAVAVIILLVVDTKEFL
jgi:hypothetical protein